MSDLLSGIQLLFDWQVLIALLIGYPLALAMSRAPSHWRARLIVLAIAPFWTSFLVRVYAWIGILGNTGLVNEALLAVGLP